MIDTKKLLALANGIKQHIVWRENGVPRVPSLAEMREWEAAFRAQTQKEEYKGDSEDFEAVQNWQELHGRTLQDCIDKFTGFPALTDEQVRKGAVAIRNHLLHCKVPLDLPADSHIERAFQLGIAAALGVPTSNNPDQKKLPL